MKVIPDGDFSKFVKENFCEALRAELKKKKVKSYEPFENLYLRVLNIHAPVNKKIIRANQKPYVSKQLRKAMRRSYLENKFYKNRSAKNRIAHKKQKR